MCFHLSRSQSSSALQGQVRLQFEQWQCGKRGISTTTLCANPAHYRLYFQCIWVQLFAVEQKIWFLFTPCAAGSINSWLFRFTRNQSYCSMWAPPFWRAMKDQICTTKLKSWFSVHLNSDYKSIEKMWPLCKILFGKSSAAVLSQVSCLVSMLCPSAHQSLKKSLNPLHYKPLIHCVYKAV